MKIATLTRAVLAASPLLFVFLTGCGDFWQAPSGSGSTSFSLTSSGNINVAPGTTGTSSIAVTPSNSFTGTVALACTVTGPTSAASPATCSLSPTSVSITGTSAVTSLLTVTTASSTTPGAYNISVTGSSSGVSESATVCAEVSTSSSATCSATASGTSGNFYVLTSNSISGYSLSSGALNPLANASYTLSGVIATSIAISPTGNFLYVATGLGLELFPVNTSTGAVSQGTIIFQDPLPEAIQIDPSGKWLLDASDAGVLYAFPITSSGAEDTSRTAQQTALLASQTVEQGGIAISPNGALVAVALGSTGTQMFPLNAANATAPIGAAYNPTTKPYGAGASIAVAIDPQSRLLYVGEAGDFTTPNASGALRVFTIASGSLKEFTYPNGTPYIPAGTGPHAILPDASGNYVYAASWGSSAPGSITGYSVTTTALTALGAATPTGTQPYGLAEDSSGSYVLAVSNSGPTFDAYTLSSGQLGTPLTNSPVSAPIAIVAAPAP